MSLVKRLAQFPLVGKLDTRSDHRLLQPPNLFAAQNVIRLRSGEWAKRGGYQTLTPTILGFTNHTMANVRKLANCNGQLVAATKDSIWSYSTARSGWVDRGHDILSTNQSVDLTCATHSITEVAFKDPQITAAGNDAKCVDVAYSSFSGIACVVWQTALHSSIVFMDEAATHQTPPISGAGAFTISGAKRTKVVYNAGYFLIFWVEESGAASTLKVKRVSELPLQPSADVTVAADLMGTATGTPWFDVQVRGNVDRVVVAYRANGPAVKALEWNPNTNAASVAAVTVVANDAAEKAIGWSQHDYQASPTPLLLTARNDAVEGVRVRVLNSTTLVQTASTTFQTSPGDVSAITGWWKSGVHHARWTLANVDPLLTKVVGCKSGGSPGDFLTIGALAGKAFEVNGYYYVLVTQPWELQPSYFVVNAQELSTGLQGHPTGIVARILPGRGQAVPPERNALTGVAFVSATKTLLGVGKVYFFDAGVSSNTIRRNAAYATVDFAGSMPEPLSHSTSVFFPGSVTRAFGGKSASEVGFNVDPEKPTCALAAGGLMSAGSYLYCMTFSYTDDEGREWESAPSLPSAAIVTSGGNLSVNVTWKNPSLFARQHNRSVVANIYRTLANRTEYFLAHTTEVVPTATTTYLDIESDAAVSLGRPLYTQGGELLNSAPPPALGAWFQGLRMLVLDSEDRTKVWASKEFQPGRGVGFHSDLAVSLDADGPNVAGASMDGRSIVFKRQAIYALNGDWPNALGVGPLPQAQRIAVGYGTVEPESVCVTPQGIWFKDPKKGLCLLDRGLNVVPAGKAAQSYDGNNVVSAILDEKHEHVRFMVATGDSPVFDYFEKQWVHWTHAAAGTLTSATIANNGTFYIANSAGEVYYYDPAAWNDVGVEYTAAIGMRFSLAGHHGIQRIYRIMLGGYCAAQCPVRAYISYDFENVLADLHSITSPMSTTDAAPGTWAWTLRPDRGRSTSLMIQFEQGGVTEGVRWSSVAIEYGVKPGVGRRMPRTSIA